MGPCRLRARATRERVVLLLVPALALRLLVPDGFMPAFGAAGITMRMCHGDGRSAAAMRLAGAVTSPAAPAVEHDAACDFAASATAAPPVVAREDAARPVRPDALTPTPDTSGATSVPRHRPQAPRAPPSVF
jgi:hypothetical protein